MTKTWKDLTINVLHQLFHGSAVKFNYLVIGFPLNLLKTNNIFWPNIYEFVNKIWLNYSRAVQASEIQILNALKDEQADFLVSK